MSSSEISPYLSFRDSARQAMEFYQSVFGGDLGISTFEEYQVSEDPSEQDKVMHSRLVTDNGMVLMAADVPNRIDLTPGTNFSVSLSGEDEEQLHGYWDKLIVGGSAEMPLEQAPWGDSFGMLTDRFGVSWMVNIAGPGGGEGPTSDAAPS